MENRLGESACAWPAHHQAMPLTPGDVHLWLGALNGSAREISDYASLLTDDEQTRAARFLYPQDRDRFVMARGFLRTLLGQYAHLAPADVRFVYNPQGKPALSGETNPDHIQFNLSHSGNWALLAIAQNRPVGVDIEQIAPNLDCRLLSRRFLCPDEQAEINNLPPAQQPAAWFRLWTIKEACVKAIGTGLTVPLAAIGQTAANPAHWKTQSLVPCSNYAAAVASEGEIVNLVCRRWAG